jgi:hypothetical protein
MSLPIRITFQGKDYTYKILTKGISRDTTSIKISFEDEELTIVRQAGKDWTVAEETIGDRAGLFLAIAKSVASRYAL